MSKEEAIAAAMAFAVKHQGIRTSPDDVRKSRDGQQWIAFYHPRHLFPEVYAKSGIVDGGEYVLLVDDATGAVTHSDF
jgi:hypothetical protein